MEVIDSRGLKLPYAKFVTFHCDGRDMLEIFNLSIEHWLIAKKRVELAENFLGAGFVKLTTAGVGAVFSSSTCKEYFGRDCPSNALDIDRLLDEIRKAVLPFLDSEKQSS